MSPFVFQVPRIIWTIYNPMWKSKSWQLEIEKEIESTNGNNSARPTDQRSHVKITTSGPPYTAWWVGLHNYSAVWEKGTLGIFLLEKCVAWSALRNCRPQLRVFLVRCKRGAAAFMASFGRFWLRFGVRVRVRVRGGVRFSPVSWSQQEPKHPNSLPT